MTASLNFSNPKAIAEKGKEIYETKYRERLERDHYGEYVAIDVLSEEAYLAHGATEAMMKASELAPKGIFHLIRIGFEAAFHMSRVRP